MSYCEDLKDVCGEAVASRKLGECYMELSEFETALEVGYDSRSPNQTVDTIYPQIIDWPYTINTTTHHDIH